MTQALFTSMTGLNAGTHQLTVVSDNVANMNTTAYKTSRVDFQDIWYQTKSTGTNSTRVSGGINPYQVGVGVQCAAITKDFSPSSTNTTGRTEDMAITGNGWFTVLNSDGKVLLTRDGNFSLDENGFLCTSDGCKVLGMDQMESLKGSTTPIKMPTQIKVVETGTPAAQFGDMTSDKLNALGSTHAGFTNGTINFTYTENGVPKKVALDPETESINFSTMSMTQIKSKLQEVLDDKLGAGKVTVGMGDGVFTFTLADKTADLKFENGTSNFVSATQLGDLPKVDGVYTTNELSMSAKIGQVDDISSDYTHNYESFSVGKDGLVTVTYDDGSVLTIKATESGATYFSYTDANGIIINGDIQNTATSPLQVDPNLLVKANMQLQLAKVVNDGGLVAEGNNQYSVGVNAGTVLYTAANINGTGAVVTGALESSNVDLAQQFSNMILAQRLVQANSQVFSSANSMLETLVYLGR